jgi:hypothetical protein
MSRAIAKAILPGAGATIMYGLYYAWKKRRMEAWRKDEIEVTVTGNEKLCLQSMLSGKSVVKNALNQLKMLLHSEFGVDLSKPLNALPADEKFSEKYPNLLSYYNFLESVYRMYKKFDEAAKNNANDDLPVFFREWFTLFDFSKSENGSASALNLEDELKQRAKSSTENTLRTVVQINKRQNSEWIQTMDHFVKTLREQSCINVDDLSIFAGLKGVFDE